MHRDNIGGGKQRFKINVVCHRAPGIRGIRVIGQHLHAESAGCSGGMDADLAKA